MSFNVLARAELGEFLGLSALVAVAVALLVFVTAIGRHTRVVRWTAFGGIAVAVVFVGMAAAGFGYEAAKSRHALGSGLNTAEQGVVRLENDDFEAAADYFREASATLEAAHDRVGGPLAAGAAFVPILAQHRSAVVDMSGVGSVGAATVAEALDEIDLDALRTVGGSHQPRCPGRARGAADPGPRGARHAAADDERRPLAMARRPGHL